MAQAITYNLTIDDTSPQIAYIPSTLIGGTPDLVSSWNEYFDGVGFNTFPGEVGYFNASRHITQMDGANFSIAFTGEYDSSVFLPPLCHSPDAAHQWVGYLKMRRIA